MTTASAAATFAVFNESYAIAGAISGAELASLKASTYQSILYLCPDADGDTGCANAADDEEGKALFTAQITAHVAFNMKDPLFSSPLPSSDDAVAKAAHLRASIGFYAELDAAFASMTTQPVLVMCKSNRRAGAVVAAREAIRRGLSAAEMMQDSTDRGLTFIGTPAHAAWASACVDFFYNLSHRQHYPHPCPAVAAAIADVQTPPSSSSAPPRFLFRQLFDKESSTYTYLIVESASREGLLIDPVIELAQRDAALVKELGVTLKYILNTHVHADHVTGSGLLKILLADASSSGPLSCIAAVSGAACDLPLEPYQTLSLGGHQVLTCLPTPGHTQGCMSFLFYHKHLPLEEWKCFTGDALLIRGCGRTDFQGGSSSSLYVSAHTQILSLPESVALYPAHDYKGNTSTTVAEELQYNPRFGKNLGSYIHLMANLNLPPPAKLALALPRNMNCGAEVIEAASSDSAGGSSSSSAAASAPTPPVASPASSSSSGS